MGWFKRLQHTAQIRMIVAVAGSARRFIWCGEGRLDRSSCSTQHEEIQGGKGAVALVKRDQPGMAFDGQRREKRAGLVR